MSGSLKDQNRYALFSLLALNAAVFFGLVQTQTAEPAQWIKAFSGLNSAIPVGLAVVLTGVVSELLSTAAKERIVFWEWEHPLPGCRAFSKHIKQDSRIDVGQLAARFGPFPTSPNEQNRLWYRIYTSVRDDPAITGVSRQYLLHRDYSALSFLMVLTLGSLALGLIRSPLLAIAYIAILFFQLALATRAARNNGVRLVTTAMAIASAK